MKIMDNQKDQKSTSFDLFITNNEAQIIFSYDNNKVEVVGSDFFEALQKGRRILEKANYRLLCKGSLINVYPSSMSRQMSRGLKAYIHHMGIHRRREDLINIFDFSDSKLIGTVDEQQIFFKLWLESLDREKA